jgi:hypothetical protein
MLPPFSDRSEWVLEANRDMGQGIQEGAESHPDLQRERENNILLFSICAACFDISHLFS